MSAVVLRADARSLPLPDGSVDLIVTSPPYWSLRDYRDGGESLAGQIGTEETWAGWLESLWTATAEWMRVLKPEGSLFVNLGDKYANDAKWGGATSGKHVAGLHGQTGIGRTKVRTGIPPKSLIGLPWRYAIGCIDRGLTLREDNIWSKVNPLPSPADDRCARSHEYLFHITKQPRYFATVDEIREPHTGTAHARRKDGQMSPKELATVSGGHRRGFFPLTTENPLGKLPSSVWEIASQALRVPGHLAEDHFAAFPMEIPRRCILGWCPPGGVVADPFGGTGTTALVAEMLGRAGLSFDLSADYCGLAMWRTQDPAERARALGVPKPPPVPDGQTALFEAS